TGGSSPLRVAVGDLNADGKADVAVANEASSTVGVLLNNGNGTFGSAQILTSGSNDHGGALAGLNGGGLPDLSTANLSTNTGATWLNTTLVVRLELQNSSGSIVAAGVPAANLAAVINNFVAPTTGVYYARVFGAGSTNYNLVVTRDAAFDTESNDTFATA